MREQWPVLVYYDMYLQSRFNQLWVYGHSQGSQRVDSSHTSFANPGGWRSTQLVVTHVQHRFIDYHIKIGYHTRHQHHPCCLWYNPEIPLTVSLISYPHWSDKYSPSYFHLVAHRLSCKFCNKICFIISHIQVDTLDNTLTSQWTVWRHAQTLPIPSARVISQCSGSVLSVPYLRGQ